jgi:putative acetyltransferase
VLDIRSVDPQSTDALALLREALIDARELYPELSANLVSPAHGPMPEFGVYVVAYSGNLPVACGAVRPFEPGVGEVKRMYVHREHRRHGYARAVLSHLVVQARGLGYSRLVLETGNRQGPAMRLYESGGFERIAPFGRYASDPTSVCYARFI